MHWAHKLNCCTTGLKTTISGCLVHYPFVLHKVYRWFSWGVASLPEGKSRGLGLVQLCAKYRLVNTTSSPYHLYRKINEAASLKVKGPLYNCLLIACLPSRSRTLNWHLKSSLYYIRWHSPLSWWQSRQMTQTACRTCDPPPEPYCMSYQ